jgi:PadR family transcriptional regulator PadR
VLGAVVLNKGKKIKTTLGNLGLYRQEGKCYYKYIVILCIDLLGMKGGEIVGISKELLKGSTAIMVLSLLEKEDMYGYQIIKELTRTSNGVFNLKEGTLYPILHSLEQGGLVESYWEDTTNKRKRKYYRLTTAGRDALAVKTREWSLFRTAVDRVIGGERRCSQLRTI